MGNVFFVDILKRTLEVDLTRSSSTVKNYVNPRKKPNGVSIIRGFQFTKMITPTPTLYLHHIYYTLH